MSAGGIFALITNNGKQDRMVMATNLLNERLKDIEKEREELKKRKAYYYKICRTFLMSWKRQRNNEGVMCNMPREIAAIIGKHLIKEPFDTKSFKLYESKLLVENINSEANELAQIPGVTFKDIVRIYVWNGVRWATDVLQKMLKWKLLENSTHTKNFDEDDTDA